MENSSISTSETVEASGLEQYGITEESVETVISDFTDYFSVRHTGKTQENTYDTEHLDSDEIPERIGREGETRVNLGLDDLQYLFADRVKNNRYDLPETDTRDAFGALFGASYALKRHLIAENGFTEESYEEFKDDIQNNQELKNFLESGAYEIRRDIMGDQGYNYEKLTEIMNPETALEAYNDIVQEATGETLSDNLMDY